MAWYRVFGTAPEGPAPEAILEFFNGLGAATGEFGGDEAGWFRAELISAGSPPLHVERFRGDEEGIRAELNSWAAWVETHEERPGHAALMERIIQAKQLFTLQGGDECLCIALCRFLATRTQGIYQIDGAGLFDADRTLLLSEA
jgi:hypothetical protein